MLKFQFYRSEDPIEPTWNHKSDEWVYNQTPIHLRPVVYDIWKWMCGNAYLKGKKITDVSQYEFFWTQNFVNIKKEIN